MGGVGGSRGPSAPAAEDYPELVEAIGKFKALYQEIDKRALKNGGEVSEEDFERLHEMFGYMSGGFTDFMYDESRTEAVRREVGELAQREMLPAIPLTATAERYYSKPRGYAGDYHSIELTYRNEPGGKGHMGRLMDRIFLETAPAKAVRNRRGLLTREIRETLAAADGATTNIMSIASGPAREITDILSSDDRPDNMKLTRDRQ